MYDPYSEARRLGMLYVAIDHESSINAYKTPPVFRHKHNEWVPSESEPWENGVDYLFLRVSPKDEKFQVPEDFTMMYPPAYYDEPYQWLYKPKTESKWALHDSVMTQEEADAEFKPLGESWEYKKLT